MQKRAAPGGDEHCAASEFCTAGFRHGGLCNADGPAYETDRLDQQILAISRAHGVSNESLGAAGDAHEH